MLESGLSEHEVADLTGRSTYGLRKKLNSRAGSARADSSPPIRASSAKELYSYFGETVPSSPREMDADIVRRINSFIQELERFKKR